MKTLLLLTIMNAATLVAQPMPLAGLISQVADGGGWKTCIYVYNSNSHPTGAEIYFYGDDGKPMRFWLAGYGDPSSSIALSWVCPMCVSSVCTANAGYETAQGYARIIAWPQLPASSNPSKNAPINSWAVFTYRNPETGQEQEAAVPGQPRSDIPLVIPYDNYRFATGIAIVNSNAHPLNIQVTVRDAYSGGTQIFSPEPAKIIRQTTWLFQAGEKRTFNLVDAFPETAGKTGVIQFQAIYGSNAGLYGIGLRFNPTGSFTTIFSPTWQAQ